MKDPEEELLEDLGYEVLEADDDKLTVYKPPKD